MNFEDNKFLNNHQNMIHDKLKLAEKNHLRMEKGNRIIRRYEESLIKYKEKYYINQITIFDKPWLYFYLFQNRLYYLPLNVEINENNAFDLFKRIQLPYDNTDEYSNTLISSLKDYLKMCKPLTYFDLVMQYKLKYKIDYCFLDHPEEFFTIIDRNLCFKNEDTSIVAITDIYIQGILKKYNLPIPTYYERKKIFCSLTKMAMQAVYDDTPPYENPYYIKYVLFINSKSTFIPNTNKDLISHEGGINISVEYCKRERMIIQRKDLFDSNFNYKRIPISKGLLKTEANYYPKYFLKLLYALTDGNIGTIDNLSEVLAYILAPRNISNNLTVFYIPKNQNTLAKLIGILVNL